MLRRGGNAIDAAVAVGYALAVVYPAAGNLGGGGFMTIVFADGRKTFIDFREKAPLAARRDMYLDKDGNVVKGLTPQGCWRSACPARWRAWNMRGRNTARMTRAALIEPAIRLAEEGFILEQGDVDMLAAATEDFAGIRPRPRSFCNDGTPFAAGERLVQRDLARTLRAIREQGADGFLQGQDGAAIVRASRRAAASSDRRISTATRPANWRRSSATIAAIT